MAWAPSSPADCWGALAGPAGSPRPHRSPATAASRPSKWPAPTGPGTAFLAVAIASSTGTAHRRVDPGPDAWQRGPCVLRHQDRRRTDPQRGDALLETA